MSSNFSPFQLVSFEKELLLLAIPKKKCMLSQIPPSPLEIIDNSGDWRHALEFDCNLEATLVPRCETPHRFQLSFHLATISSNAEDIKIFYCQQQTFHNTLIFFKNNHYLKVYNLPLITA